MPFAKAMGSMPMALAPVTIMTGVNWSLSAKIMASRLLTPCAAAVWLAQSMNSTAALTTTPISVTTPSNTKMEIWCPVMNKDHMTPTNPKGRVVRM